MRVLELDQDISPKPSLPLNEQMFESINLCMERLEDVVSDMVEILALLEQDSIKEPEIQGMT